MAGMEGGEVRPSLINTVMSWAGKEFNTNNFSFLALETHLTVGLFPTWEHSPPYLSASPRLQLPGPQANL